MTYSKRKDYSTKARQEDKSTTLERAKTKPNLALDMLGETGLFDEIVHYQPESSRLHLGNAPAVEVATPDGSEIVIVWAFPLSVSRERLLDSSTLDCVGAR